MHKGWGKRRPAVVAVQSGGWVKMPKYFNGPPISELLLIRIYLICIRRIISVIFTVPISYGITGYTGWGCMIPYRHRNKAHCIPKMFILITHFRQRGGGLFFGKPARFSLKIHLIIA